MAPSLHQHIRENYRYRHSTTSLRLPPSLMSFLPYTRPIFDKHNAYITHGNKTLIRGTQAPNGLWTVLPTFKTYKQQINLVTTEGTRLEHRIKDHLRFLHAACFSPVPSTWEKAVKNNNFVTWPAITAKNITKHLKNPGTGQGTPGPTTKKYSVNKKQSSKKYTKPGRTRENIQSIYRSKRNLGFYSAEFFRPYRAISANFQQRCPVRVDFIRL